MKSPREINPSLITFILQMENPLISHIVISTLVFGTVLLGWWLAMSTKKFKGQSQEIQDNAKKQFRWMLYATPVMIVGSYLLQHADVTTINYFVVACYFAILVLAFWFFWRSYRVGIRGDVNLIKGMNGKVLQQPERFIRAFAVINFLNASAMLALFIAIPLYSLGVQAWAPLIGGWAAISSMIISHFEKKSTLQ